MAIVIIGNVSWYFHITVSHNGFLKMIIEISFFFRSSNTRHFRFVLKIAFCNLTPISLLNQSQTYIFQRKISCIIDQLSKLAANLRREWYFQRQYRLWSNVLISQTKRGILKITNIYHQCCAIIIACFIWIVYHFYEIKK